MNYDDLNVLTIRRQGDIWHVSDTLYGSSTTTGTFADALLWASSALERGGPPIILRWA